MKADIVILGAGSAGEMLATLLGKAGKSVLMIEPELIGGECPFYSCMPSKAMLRSAALRFDAAHTIEVGATATALQLDDRHQAFAAAVARREKICEGHSDLANEQNLTKLGVKIVRGLGRIAKPGVVTVGEIDIEYNQLVISTGSIPVIPPIPGLLTAKAWTTDKALTSSELPDSLIVIGGGPAGCELAQIYSRFGTKVTIVEPEQRLLLKEEESISLAFGEMLKAEGIELLCGTAIVSVESSGNGEATVVLADGRRLKADRMLVATGRKPMIEGIGLEILGIKISEQGAILTDQHCRVMGQDNIWAAGDVAGIAPLVHTANYQARIIAAGLLGEIRSANYDAIPRSVYTYPAVASVGLTYADAIAAGIDAITAKFEIEKTSRNTVDGGTGGVLTVTADRKSRMIIGAAAIGPHCDEWITEAVLAIRGQIPLETLVDVVHAFPTYSDSYEEPYRKLLAEL
jgi:dihydrolipoamide dehydrogenase